MELQLKQATLQDLEAKIETGLKTFVEVGLCLLEIRDRKLYKEQGYSRFEDYCQEKWGWSKTHVNRNIEAAKTAAILTPMGVIPATERQARELAPLIKTNEQEAIEIWREIKEKHGDNVTAQIIRDAVQDKLKPSITEKTQEIENIENGCWNCKHNKYLKGGDGSDFYCENYERVLYYDGNLYSDECWESEEKSSVVEEKKPHIAYNSGNNEWYTPPEYIEAAKKVMGNIDLDPASSDMANKTVKAERYFTAQDDGLSQVWQGKVWMNPPYAADLIGQFCSKLTWHYSTGDVSEAIALVNNATETAWFNALIEYASAVVFPKTRVKFRMPNGDTGSPLQGQAVIYFGKSPGSFMAEFKVFGWGAYL
jgi:ParB family chromosome partitioning protein